MYKVQIGQLLAKNGLSMDEFMEWMEAYGTIKFYKDGSPNYFRCDVDRFIMNKKGEVAKLE